MAVFVRPLNDTMCDNQCEEEIESLPLPKGWSKTVRHAVLTDEPNPSRLKDLTNALWIS